MRILPYGTAPSEIATLLKKGKIIVYPTETAYGIGADPANKKAIAKIYLMKKRSKKKPLLLIASSIAQVLRHCRMNKIEKRLAKKNWPGAFTMILRMKTNNGLALNYKEVGIRVSGLRFARLIARHLRNPIISTSANISGSKTPYSAEEVIGMFSLCQYKPDYIIDAGTLPKRNVSRIVKIENDKILVLR